MADLHFLQAIVDGLTKSREELSGRLRELQGDEQFLSFMDEVRKAVHRQLFAANAAELMAEAALEDSDVDRFLTPQWMARSETLSEEHERAAFVLEVLREDHLLASLDPTTGAATVSGITPGRYVLKTNTGWVLGREEVTEEDVVWTRAFPGASFRAAADTEAEPGPATIERSYLDGEVVLRVLPGLERGMITIATREGSG